MATQDQEEINPIDTEGFNINSMIDNMTKEVCLLVLFIFLFLCINFGAVGVLQNATPAAKG